MGFSPFDWRRQFLKNMLRFLFQFGHLTDDNDCPECAAVLAELENIDDEADKFGEITFIPFK